MPAPRRVSAATARGVVGAMAMTGSRTLAGSLGLVDRTPPEEVVTEALGGWWVRVPEQQREGVAEAFHWLTGALAGALFGLLPDTVADRRCCGPAYGVVVLGGYELFVAPWLGISPHQRSGAERIAFLTDHLLFGLVLASPASKA